MRRGQSETREIPHVTVCICTFRRVESLERLLKTLVRQRTDGEFSFSVVVVDNDGAESARPVVMALAPAYPTHLMYCVEEEQSIARARNRAVANAQGDFIAFIDDDEWPIEEWLLTLVTQCVQRKVDGVLGPVQPHYESTPPRWIIRGRFHERDNYPTGSIIDGNQGRTGNVLLRRSVFTSGEEPFRPEFVTGEDQDFFRRKIAAGHVFTWCREAVAFEDVPPARWKRAYVLRKALMRGRYSILEPTFGFGDAAKSILAIGAYAVALPVLSLGDSIAPCAISRSCASTPARFWRAWG